jgi:tryptophan 2,3-dioxygenase
MTLSWDVLATLTPTDYTSFRDVLGSSSASSRLSSGRWNICWA